MHIFLQLCKGQMKNWLECYYFLFLFFCCVLVRERQSKPRWRRTLEHDEPFYMNSGQMWSKAKLTRGYPVSSLANQAVRFLNIFAFDEHFLTEAFSPSFNYIQLRFLRGLTANQRNPPAARLPVCLPTGVLAKCFTSRFRISEPHSSGSPRIQGSDP